MTNKIFDGKNIPVVLAADANPGDVVVIGVNCGVLLNGGVTGDTVTAEISGVYELPKATGALAQGAKVYFSATNGNVSATNTDVFCGYVYEAAQSADSTVQVLLGWN